MKTFASTIGVLLLVATFGPLNALAQDKSAKPADKPAAKPEAKPAEKPAAKPADAPSAAGDVSGKYAVDPVHSTNVFRIKHMNTAFFYGRFNQMEGDFTLDEKDPTKSTFDVKLKTESIDTNNAARDKHMRSPEYFDAEKNPDITFKSKSVKKAADGSLEVTGDLTLRGVTKPLTAKVELTGSGKGMRDEVRAGWETTFTVKRSDYEMTAGQGALGDEVRITVSVEGVKQ